MYFRLLGPTLASIAAGLSLSAAVQSANPAGISTVRLPTTHRGLQK
jgi:hypothetical protein